MACAAVRHHLRSRHASRLVVRCWIADCHFGQHRDYRVGNGSPLWRQRNLQDNVFGSRVDPDDPVYGRVRLAFDLCSQSAALRDQFLGHHRLAQHPADVLRVVRHQRHRAIVCYPPQRPSAPRVSRSETLADDE